LAPVFEEEPEGHDGELVLWGEGFKYPAPGALGAQSRRVEEKVARKWLLGEGEEQELPWHGVVPIKAGQILRTCPPGGGGVGDPFERDIAAVVEDVRNEFVSVAASREDYGVAVDPETLEVDLDETGRLRSARGTDA
jgi:N-methylhydantoinase B